MSPGGQDIQDDFSDQGLQCARIKKIAVLFPKNNVYSIFVTLKIGLKQPEFTDVHSHTLMTQEVAPSCSGDKGPLCDNPASPPGANTRSHLTILAFSLPTTETPRRQQGKLEGSTVILKLSLSLFHVSPFPLSATPLVRKRFAQRFTCSQAMCLCL